MIYIFIATVSTLNPLISQETVERKEMKIELFGLKEAVSTYEELHSKSQYEKNLIYNEYRLSFLPCIMPIYGHYRVKKIFRGITYVFLASQLEISVVGDEEELRKKNQWSDQKNKKAQVIFNITFSLITLDAYRLTKQYNKRLYNTIFPELAIK